MIDNLKPLTFLVLSDIHFGASSYSPDFAIKSSPPPHLISNVAPMMESLLNTVSRGHIDSILITGDLTTTGGPSEFKECLDSVNIVAERASVDRENIYFAFGNHDVNWRISKLAEPGDGLGFQDNLYHEVAASVGNIYIENSKANEKGPLPGSGIYCRDNYIVYVVNSGFYSIHSQDHKHGKIGIAQYKWLAGCIDHYADSSKWHILMLHHHPFKYTYPTIVQDMSCLEEGSELVDLIGKSQIDIVCHGHRHHPKLFTELKNNWKSPVTFFCAGSLAVNERHRYRGVIPNLFHIIKLEDRSEKCAAIGTIESFEYSILNGWIPCKFSEFVPLDGIQTFGSVSTELENEKEAEDLISNILGRNEDQFIALPKLSALPLSLKCVNLEVLNALMKNIVNEKFKLKLIGKYPDEIAIVR